MHYSLARELRRQCDKLDLMTRANPHTFETQLSSQHIELRRRATYASVSVATTLIAVKLVAYLMTDSVSLLSSLMDSAMDAFASVVMLIGVHHATRPADEKHRYGHGKYEALASMLQAVFIAGSGLFLVIESLHRFVEPRAISNTGVGIGVMVFSILLTLALVAFQHHVIRKTDSVAISADSLHYKGDLLINLAVIAAILLTRYTGWTHFDPLFALGIAAVLLKGAWEIGRQSIDILADRELSEEERRQIYSLVLSNPDVCGIHDLRTRTTGLQVFIEFHLEIEGDFTLHQAHDVTERIERQLYDAFPNSEVIIHQEPSGITDDRLDHRVEGMD